MSRIMFWLVEPVSATNLTLNLLMGCSNLWLYHDVPGLNIRLLFPLSIPISSALGRSGLTQSLPYIMPQKEMLALPIAGGSRSPVHTRSECLAFNPGHLPKEP